MGFHKSEANMNLYYIVVGNGFLIHTLYVDELFIIGKKRLIVVCNLYLASKYEMKDIGLMHNFLVLEFW